MNSSSLCFFMSCPVMSYQMACLDYHIPAGLDSLLWLHAVPSHSTLSHAHNSRAECCPTQPCHTRNSVLPNHRQAHVRHTQHCLVTAFGKYSSVINNMFALFCTQHCHAQLYHTHTSLTQRHTHNSVTHRNIDAGAGAGPQAGRVYEKGF